ncbi:hypothetical protein SteCoe_12352 [Stentor coeruleus]|uniref:Uncharacterized protein n=1 Tax=Stentor coeruleus TaxID=5963 RepID=A0A1R2CB43_9CILI|nr:hypothetical protein SteCoe_12352 [Stentor coeruleus]
MWRSFACGFANHAYDNFIKKYGRVESAPANPRKAFTDNYELESMTSLRSLSFEVQKRMEEYSKLKSKVADQRKKIKETDYEILKRKELKIRNIKSMQETEKFRKKQYLQHIRESSKNKTRKFCSLDLRPNTNRNDKPNLETKIFALTSPRTRHNLPGFSKVSTHRRKEKEPVSVREFQENVMKDLKQKVPTYYKELKEEFNKIREHCEMTFEQYKASKRLKRKNPYNFRFKIKQNDS